LLPLTHVDNCADAVALAALRGQPGSAFNVVDDGLPTCQDYLLAYQRAVRRLRVVPIPYPMLLAGSYWLAAYNRRSRGQLPAVFTPYTVRSMYRKLRYSNAALKALGWTPQISVAAGMAATFTSLREAAAP
jgi:nucleoside-diphosphate-sugar epimerase